MSPDSDASPSLRSSSASKAGTLQTLFFESCKRRCCRQGPGCWQQAGAWEGVSARILGELELAPVGSALEIPLVDVGRIGLANLRSAVHRAATSQGLAIETLADETNFYVRKTANSK